MVRSRRFVNECPACMSVAEAHHLKDLGGKIRPFFRDRTGALEQGVIVTRVLCWWCREYHPPTEVESCMKIPEKRATTNGAAGCSLNASAAGLLSPFSELWAFLTGNAETDGKRRLPGKLSLSCAAGRLSLTLNDPQTGQYCHLDGEALDDLLLMAESGLADGSLPWRPSSYSKPGKAR